MNQRNYICSWNAWMPPQHPVHYDDGHNICRRTSGSLGNRFTTSTLDHVTTPSNNTPSFLPWYIMAELCVTKEVSTISWSYSRPLSGRMDGARKWYVNPSIHPWWPLDPMGNHPRSPSLHTCRPPWNASAGHCPGPTVVVFATQEDLQLLNHNLGLKTLEGNSIPFQVSWGSHWSSQSFFWDPVGRTPLAHLAHAASHVGSGRSHIQPSPSYPTLGHPNPATWTAWSGSTAWFRAGLGNLNSLSERA